MKSKKTIAIIGGGASALFFASLIDTSKFSVTIYEKNKALGRKFLVAGDGGFNLTHAESIEQMVQRYTPSFFLENALVENDNTDFREWLLSIGVPTFEGSSHRIYPEKGIKPIEVFNAILHQIKKNNVVIKYQQEWMGWKGEDLLFNSSEEVNADIVIFALGGASWKKTGSKGDWLSHFEQKKINTMPFQASNCANEVEWENDFVNNHAGTPLKNIAITCGKATQKGEVVITAFGLEGNAIYALSPCIRERLNENGKSTIHIDFKPSLSVEKIIVRLNSSGNRTKILKDKLKLPKSVVELMKINLSKDEFMKNETLADRIKSFPLEIVNSAPIDEAISTVGGISLEELNSSFEFKNMPNYYAMGEMIDWDAPTGGYLLQACYSMGKKIAHHLNEKK